MNYPPNITRIRPLSEEDIQRAMSRSHDLFQSGYACAECVLKSCADALGVKSPYIPRIATGMCAGMAYSGGVCGAVSGGTLALGLMLGRDKPDDNKNFVYEAVEHFQDDFISKHGSIDCRTLTGVDLRTHQGHQEFDRCGMEERCHDLAADAVGMVLRALKRM